MQQTRFMVLTGHLNDYPLPDLVGILRHQRKTGRLIVEYPVGPGSFFFKDGELVDVQLGELNGIQAVCIAISQPNAAFNFNPLIVPSAQSIDNSLQKVVTQLLDCWDMEEPPAAVATPEIKSVGDGRETSVFLPPTSHEFIEGERALPEADNILALPPLPPTTAAAMIAATPNRSAVKSRKRMLFAGAAVLLLLSVPAVIAFTTNSFGKRETRASSNSSTVEVKDTSTNPAPDAPASSQTESSVNASSGAATTVVAGNERREERRPPREQFKAETDATKSNESVAAPPLPPPPTPLPSSTKPKESDATIARQNTDAASAQPPAAQPSSAASGAATGEQTLTIVMQVENGRVTGANVANRRPGMEAFEASALRIARQRRFPANTSGTETVRIKVTGRK
ncbi:MAG: DUF4388 domain-containing protein [Pyrinomonadaceae bacterium]|nr:DUF4388 domain-containing protein [Pyrinomonadaceae bacterium]